MTDKKKRGRPPGSKGKPKTLSSFKELQEVMNEEVNGHLVVKDPIQAAALARAPFCASAKDEVPFPEDWDKLGKIDKLQWLTANRK